MYLKKSVRNGSARMGPFAFARLMTLAKDRDQFFAFVEIHDLTNFRVFELQSPRFFPSPNQIEHFKSRLSGSIKSHGFDYSI